jgi:hypothetical protein
MRAAKPNELTERAVPVLAAQVSEAELADLIPVEFQDINDPDATAEPSKGALIQLAAGPFVVLFYGKESGRLVLESPASANAVTNVRSFLEEVPISSILWIRPDVLNVFRQEAKSAAGLAVSSSRSRTDVARRGRTRSQVAQQHSKKASSRRGRQPDNAAEPKDERLKKAPAPRAKQAKKKVEKEAKKTLSKGGHAKQTLKEVLEASPKRLAKAAKAI